MASEPSWLRGRVERILERSQARRELRGKAGTPELMRRLASENNTSLEEMYRWQAELKSTARLSGRGGAASGSAL